MDEKIRFSGWAAWLDGDSIWWCQDEHCGSAPMQPRTGFEEDMLDEIRRLRAEAVNMREAIHRGVDANVVLQVDLDRCRAKLEECKRDAKRYRRLRDNPQGNGVLLEVLRWGDEADVLHGAQIDFAIDALAAKGE